MRKLLIRLAVAASALALTLPASAQLAPGQIPEIPAFLPMAATVPKSEATPIDGTWTISSIGKRIRIEAGRAFAVDPWLHLFVLKIQPGMVVIRNIRTTDGRVYSGDDLPLMGTFSGTLNSQGSIDVTVAGALGPVRYTLSPVELDNRDWYQQVVGGQAAVIPVTPPAAPPVAPPPTAPVEPPPVAVAPPADTNPGGGAMSCKNVVYREETDDFECIQ